MLLLLCLKKKKDFDVMLLSMFIKSYLYIITLMSLALGEKKRILYCG